MLVGERADYLERRADELGATVEVSQFFFYIFLIFIAFDDFWCLTGGGN